MRHRDPAGEQRREHPARRPGVVHLLADDHRVGAVAAAAADRLGKAAPAAPPRRPCGAARAAARRRAPTRRRWAGPRVRRTRAPSFAAAPVRGCARCSQQNSSGMSMWPAAQPLAQPLGLRIEPRLIGHALAEDALDDEVDRPQVRQQMPGDRQIGCLGQQFAQLRRRSACAPASASARRCGPTRRRSRCRPCRRCVRPRSGRAATAGSPRTAAARAARTAARAPVRRSRSAGAMSMRVPSACTATCGTSVAAT